MEQKSGDGFDSGLYKRFYDIWVRSTSDMLNEIMRSPHMASAMGRTLEGSLDFKKKLDELLESSLKGLRLPTSSEISSLTRRISALEQQVHEVSQKIGDLKTHPLPGGKDPSSRKRPSRQAR